jgi:type I restriction enzyme M protein
MVSDNGKAIFCLPQGMLFSNGHEKLLRKYLIENKYVEAVIEMPSGTFYPYTMINTALVMLSKKENAKIHFINATSIFSKTRRGSNGLFLEDAKKIHGEYLLSEEEQSVFSKYVPYQEVVENDYLFTSNKYFLEEKIKIAGVKEYKKLGELAKITRGVQYKSDELDQKETALPSGNFYLSVKNIKDNEIDDELFYLDCIEEKYSNLILQENDILLGMVISDTAKIVLVKDLEDKKIIPASNLYIIRADKDAINPVFLKVLLESKNALEVFQGFSANAKALPSIKADFLNNLQIPIIPAEEQLRIAEKYEKMEAEKKRLKAEMNKLLAEKDNLISDFEAQNYICSVKTH